MGEEAGLSGIGIGIGIRSHQESVTVEASAETLYDLVSDISRTGEWSPVCTSCWWDDQAEAGQVGAWFTGTTNSRTGRGRPDR